MVANTKIEWAKHTWNPWIGCTKVGPPCDHCYAEALMDHRLHRAAWGAGKPRTLTSDKNFNLPFEWDAAAARAGRRDTVFCLSLGDIWDNEVDPAWRARAFKVMRKTPHLIYLLLSKRIGNAVEMAVEAGGLPGNAALGSTLANQVEWDRDAGKLEAAAIALHPMFTFASVEPMLGRIKIRDYCPDWVIAGGESGKASEARDMPEAWPEELCEQVCSRGKAFFMKQMTMKRPIPPQLMVRNFPPALAA